MAWKAGFVQNKRLMGTLIAGLIVLIAGIGTVTLLSLNQRMPDDFDFDLVYGVGGKNRINTYEDQFTKDLVVDGTATIPFEIPEEEMQRIYEQFVELEIADLPGDLTVWPSVTPANQIKFTVTFDGNTKTIIWPEGYWDPSEQLPDEQNRFVKFMKYIVVDYMFNTEEYKNIPKARGGYD